MISAIVVSIDFVEDIERSFNGQSYYLGKYYDYGQPG